MRHNARSQALEHPQDVVLSYGLGRGPIGSVQGMLYLMDDAFIIGFQSPSERTVKREQLILQ